MNLCLGTVQFGMDYGVFQQPKKSPDYCIKCLDYATQNGINAIDTAAAYGTAEEITGMFLNLKTVPRDKLFLSTKLMPNVLDEQDPSEYFRIIRERLERSLRTLHTDYVDVYYLHSSRYAFNDDILAALERIHETGLARKVGVSVYYPEEAAACFASGKIDHIQAPYSIFDHRMKENGVFEKAENCGCGIDVRSAFIKGLIRLSEAEVPEHLAKAKPILRRLDDLCRETGFSRIDIALGYIKREKLIEHIVFGIRDLGQLKEDIASYGKELPTEIFDTIDKEFSGIDADIIIPSLWAKG